MITPRVITSQDEATQVTQDYMRQFRGLSPLRVINETPAADLP